MMSADVGYVLGPRSGARTLQLRDIAAPEVVRALNRDALAEVRGDFRVCPVSYDAYFQEKIVCVERAKRMRVTPRNRRATE
jgi:hypothetical protein